MCIAQDPTPRCPPCSVPRALTDTIWTTVGGHTYTVAHILTNQAGGTDRTTITSNVPAMSFLDRRYVHDATTGGLHAITLGTAATTFGYNDAAQRNTTMWPSGVTGGATYLSTGGYASQQYGALTSAIDRAFSADYVADSAGRLLRDHRTNAAGTADVNRVFGYDALGQFTGVTDASALPWTCGGSGRFDPDYGDVGCAMDTVTAIRSYAYDLVGNRSTTFLSGTQYAGDRLVQLPDVVNGSGTYYQYTYDNDGNVQTKTKTATGETWTYAWSAENTLTSVTHVRARMADSTVTYSSDAFGQPVKTWRGATLERLSLYDGGQLLADLAPDGTRLAEYVYDAGTDTPHAVLSGATVVTDTEYVAQDGLGNVTGTFTSNSSATTPVQRITYGDWGAPSVTGSSPNRLFWKGLAYDSDAGLYYMRARWYDPDAGRFVSEDPAGLQGGINPYVFAGNDPINGADPSGATAPENTYLVCEIGERWWICWDITFNPGSTAATELGQGTVRDLPSDPFANPFPSGTPRESDATSSFGDPNTRGTGSTASPDLPGHGYSGSDAPKRTKPGPFPKRLFGTHWCGIGGGGPPLNALDTACMHHDVCYGSNNLTAASNLNPAAPAAEVRALYRCNQQLCNEVLGPASQDEGSSLVFLFFHYVPYRARCY